VVQLDTMVRLAGYYLVMDLVGNRYLYVEAARAYHAYHKNTPLVRQDLHDQEFMIGSIHRPEVYDKVIVRLIKQLYLQGETA
jgi:hypothetical protein